MFSFDKKKMCPRLQFPSIGQNYSLSMKAVVLDTSFCCPIRILLFDKTFIQWLVRKHSISSTWRICADLTILSGHILLLMEEMLCTPFQNQCNIKKELMTIPDMVVINYALIRNIPFFTDRITVDLNGKHLSW